MDALVPTEQQSVSGSQMEEPQEATAFALEEYQVPRHGKDAGVFGGTMPKAQKDKGGLFAEVNRLAGAVPGPEKYHKDILEQSFVGRLKGGKFSCVGRSWIGGSAKGTNPSVGTYEIDKAIDKTSSRRRPPGGRIANGNRKCFFAEQAEKNTMPAPGKYDPKMMKAHMDSPVFSSPRTESRSPKKASPMGPGYYNPGHAVVEKRVLVYSGCKEDAKSFLDKIMNKKDKTPAPGHVGIPSSKWEDRAGRALHSTRLLLDRHIVPRGIDGARRN